MITSNGYSKDPNIIPEGIVITLPKIYFEETGVGTGFFVKSFEQYMDDEEAVWNFKLKNLPKLDVAFVYIIFDKEIQYRANLVMYERNVSKVFQDPPYFGKVREFKNKNWVLLTGPIVKPPYEIPLKGFQGFRYCTKLF